MGQVIGNFLWKERNEKLDKILFVIVNNSDRIRIYEWFNGWILLDWIMLLRSEKQCQK